MNLVFFTIFGDDLELLFYGNVLRDAAAVAKMSVKPGPMGNGSWTGTAWRFVARIGFWDATIAARLAIGAISTASTA